MRMKRTAWSRRVLTAFALLGLVGFTFATPVETTFTFPTTAPDGWTDREKPTTAEQVTLEGSNFELENKATDSSGYKQTLGSYSANVAEILGNTGSACEIFGLHGNSSGSRQTAEHDIWLKVSGGTYSYVIGGAENNWSGSKATFLKGNIFLELASGATVNNDLIGVLDKGGVGLDRQSATVLTGNAMVVVSGGTVSGNVVGGIASAHNATPVIVGNTLVRILSVLSGSNRVLGGSYYRTNANSSAKHTGNTAVEVELADDTTASTFTKEIVGGSYGTNGGNYAITGSTSVSISAPDTVTFSSPIYGASVAASTSTTTSVSGDSSVTIDGGTYTSGIYAAGFGTQATVAGTATLTLKAGVFSGATLGVGNNGSAVSGQNATSALVIAGAIDLSNATLNGDFKTVSLQGNLTLGTNRVPSATLTVDSSEARTLTLTLTDTEYANFSAELATFSGDTAPSNVTVAVKDPTGATTLTGWSLKVADGKLICSRDSTTRTWSKPADSTDWSAGLNGFTEGDNVTFGTNTEQETVTLPADGVRVKDLTVEGSYSFDGTTGILTTTTATINAGGTFATGTGFTFPVTTLRLTPKTPNVSGNSIALAELVLMQDSTVVKWPDGTTIVQKNTDGTTTSPTWGSGGNEAINALIDGVYNTTSTSGGTYTNPATGATGTYSGQAKNNKWFFSTEGTSAVITLGSAVTFNGYVLYSADHTPRNPTAWTLEGSVDGGTTWVTLSEQSGVTPPSANSAYNSGTPYSASCTASNASGTVLAVAQTFTVNGTLSSSYGITASSVTFGATGILAGTPTLTADTITFDSGSTIKVPASGVATLVGTVSGTAKIDLTEYLASTEPAEGETFPVLKAPEGLTLTPHDGYMVGSYADGYYTMYKSTPTWTAGSDNNTWSNTARWTGLNDASEIPTTGTIFVNFGSGDATTLTIDTAASATTLRVFGASGSTIELGTSGSLTVGTLTAETDFTLPATASVTSASITTDKTLTLSGTGNLSTAFTTAGTLVLSGGTFTLTSSASLDTLTAVAINKGATLDFAGLNRNSASFTLAGGTIKNSSGTTVNVGPVTLSANSYVDTTGGVVQFNAANNARNDLTLGGYTLTKTGTNLFDVMGADIDSGTIRIEEGMLKLSSLSGDSTLTGTKLSFAEGANYFQKSSVDHWIRSSSGTVTLDADEGAEVDFSGTYFVGGFALTKTGAGTISVNSTYVYSTNCWWTGATTVNGGTLVLNQTNADISNGNTFTVASGATFKKTGSRAFNFNGQLSGAGTIEIAGGSATTAKANGGYGGSWKIASGATLSSSSGNYWLFTTGGTIEVNGTLVVGGAGNSAFRSAFTGAGTLQIGSGKPFICTEGFSFSGPSLVCNGVVTGDTNAAFTIAKDKTLSGTGSIAGVVALNDGATLDASTATTNACLSLSGTVTAGGNVKVTLPTDLSSGLKLLGWSSAPESTTYTATITDPLASLRAKDAGLYYDVMSIDGGKSGSDTKDLDGLSDDAKRTLAEAAFDKGATSIESVSGTRGNETLDSTAIDEALSCFALTPEVTVSEGKATITVSYDFGISKFTLKKDTDNNPQVVVKAEVQCGETLAQLTSAATMVLQKKSISSTDEWATVTGATFERDSEGVYTATVSLSDSDIANVKFRVLATTATSN